MNNLRDFLFMKKIDNSKNLNHISMTFVWDRFPVVVLRQNTYTKTEWIS